LVLEILCGDLLDRTEATFAALKYRLRVLKPNEGYYRAYDEPGKVIDEDSIQDSEDE